MAEKKKISVNYKATPRFFEWVAEPGGVFSDYWKDLKDGKEVDLKKVSTNRLQWCLDNELITQV